MRMANCSLKPTDYPLGHEFEPRLGAHLVTPRCGYTHHGIYVGANSVVQYGGLSWGLRRGPVEEVSLSRFSQGRPVWIRGDGLQWFEPQEIVHRARLRIGEDRYNVLKNNCEHFCEWCVHGEHRSYQVDDRAADYRGVFLRLIDLLARSRSPRHERGTADCLRINGRYDRAIDDY